MEVRLVDRFHLGQSVPHTLPRRLLRGLIHFFSYHLILTRKGTRRAEAAGRTMLLTGGARWLCLALDRIDSTAAMLLGLAVAAPLPLQTAVLVAVFGPAVHLAFSAALFAIGVKARLA